MLATIFLLVSCSNSDTRNPVRFPLLSVGSESNHDFIWTVAESTTNSDSGENLAKIAVGVSQDITSCIGDFAEQASADKAISFEYTVESVRAINIEKTDFVDGYHVEFKLRGEISDDNFTRLCASINQKLEARFRSFGFRKIRVMKASIRVDY